VIAAGNISVAGTLLALGYVRTGDYTVAEPES
jgi:hypothetical protein